MEWRKIADMPEELKASEKFVALYGPDGWDKGCWERHWGENGKWVRHLTSEYDNECAIIADPTHYCEITPPESDHG